MGAFKIINNPLRDLERQRRGGPHPVPFTCFLIDKAVGKLRAVGAKGTDANAEISLWRGLKNVQMRDEFMQKGGTELAPMSTTTDVKVAILYSMSDNCILLKLLTKSSMERGADLRFLSAFPVVL